MGHTRRSDYRSHHYEEGYSVHGPFGSIGIRVYYEYDLQPYFGSNEIYSEEKNEQQNSKETQDSESDRFQYKVSDKYDLEYFDQIENEKTQQYLIESDSE